MLKEAIRIAESDRLREKPLRDLLLDVLMDAKVTDDKEVAIRLIDKGVAKYKCAHPKKDILSLLDDSKKFNVLCDQLYQLSGKGRNLTEEIKAKETTLGRNVLRVSLLANGQYCAYSTPLENERDDRMIDFYWVAKTRYQPTKKGIAAQNPTFVILKAFTNDETVKYEADNITEYIPDNNIAFSSLGIKKRFLNRIEKEGDTLSWEEMIAMKSDEMAIREFIHRYRRQRKIMTDASSSNHVIEPYTRIIIGATIIDSTLYTISMECLASEYINWLITGEEVLISEFKDIYSKVYFNKESAHERVDQNLERFENRPLHEVMMLHGSGRKAKSGLLMEKMEEMDYVPLQKDRCRTYSLSASIEILRKSGKPVFIRSDIGENIDAWLGVCEPENFQPFLCRTSNGGEAATLDVFLCDEESNEKLNYSYLSLNNWQEVEKKFRQTGYAHYHNKDIYDVTCEWVEVPARRCKGITAYKSFTYKEIFREKQK